MNEILDILIVILAKLESRGDPNVVNVKKGAVGILQIHSTLVKDLKELNSLPFFDPNVFPDPRFDPKWSHSACASYLYHWGRKVQPTPESPELWIETLARIWIGGPKGYEKKSTIVYGQKAVQIFKEYQSVYKMFKIHQKFFSNPNDPFIVCRFLRL